jgi:hypothetical protein
MPMFPSMPDVVGSHPVAVWKAGDYLLVLATDLKPLSARVIGEAAASGLHYDAALAVIDRRINYPRMYITLERSIGGQFLCRFTEAGMHENCGLVHDMSLEAFAAKALEMFKTHFGYSGEIERAQMAPKPEAPETH